MEVFIKKSWREPLMSVGLLIMRVWIGLVMIIAHGWPKLSNFSNMSDSFHDPIGIGSTLSLTLAVGAEVFASILIILGLATRVAAIPLLITMLVAGLLHHSDDPFRDQEFALLYGFTYLMFIFTGPGKYSLDNALEKRWKKR